MENQKDPLLDPEDRLKAENNLLKLKLGLEYGMKMEDTSSLSPVVENEWLNCIYAFEQQFKDAKRVSLYDYIGQPLFSKWDTLTPLQTSQELRRIRDLMSKRSVALDCICEYDDAIIYRFLTEELFQHEMDDMRIPGMTYHLIYEEFYPNHDYDLRRHTSDFIRAVFTRAWDHEFDNIIFARSISFLGKDYDRSGISSMISTFQEAHEPFRIEMLDITEVVVHEGLTKGDVHANLSVSGKMRQGDNVRYEDACSFHFVREDGYWYIGDFDIPGFAAKKKS